MFKFLARAGCHLCDETRPMVEKTIQRLGHGLIEVDVDSDPMLSRDFGERVPVVLGPANEVIAEGRIEARSLQRALRGWQRDRPSR